MLNKTKKITRKGCRNVQLVRVPDEEPNYWGDYHWEVQKIHKNKPATFVSKKIQYIYNGLNGETLKRPYIYTKFPIRILHWL